MRDLNLPDGVSFARSERRREMLAKMDAFSRQVEEGAATQNRDAFYEQAYRLLGSPEAKGAFDLSQEKPALRERYGHGKIGTGCLLARRLVEAGSRFVTVVDTGWDTHHADLPRAARFALRRQRQTARTSIAPMPRSSPTCASAACSTPRSS